MSDIRVFISIPIPDRSPLEPLSAMLGSMRNTRPSPIDQVHITLRFIGDIDESRIDDIEDCVRRAADGEKGRESERCPPAKRGKGR